MEGLNCLTFSDIIEYTEGSIENEKIFLPKWLNMFPMFQIILWYNQGDDDQNTVKNVVVRCSN